MLVNNDDNMTSDAESFSYRLLFAGAIILTSLFLRGFVTAIDSEEMSAGRFLFSCMLAVMSVAYVANLYAICAKYDQNEIFKK